MATWRTGVLLGVPQVLDVPFPLPDQARAIEILPIPVAGVVHGYELALEPAPTIPPRELAPSVARLLRSEADAARWLV